MDKAKVSLALLLLPLVLSPSLALGQQTPDVETMAQKLFCTCGCNLLLSTCETQMVCEVAKQMKAELQLMIDKGMTEEEILNRMKGKYGDQVLAIPPMQGFTLALWTYPMIGGVVGLIALVMISRRRRGVKWYVDPDDAPSLDEESFAAFEDGGEKGELQKTSLKYDQMLKERLKELKKKEVKK